MQTKLEKSITHSGSLTYPKTAILSKMNNHKLPPHQTIIYFDGICLLCNRFLRFILLRDSAQRFIAMPLQSKKAKETLKESRIPELTTLIVSTKKGLLTESDAALFCLSELGGIYKIASLFTAIPKSIRNAIYRIVATHRYQWFGVDKNCKIPEKSIRDRVIFD